MLALIADHKSLAGPNPRNQTPIMRSLSVNCLSFLSPDVSSAFTFNPVSLGWDSCPFRSTDGVAGGPRCRGPPAPFPAALLAAMLHATHIAFITIILTTAIQSR